MNRWKIKGVIWYFMGAFLLSLLIAPLRGINFPLFYLAGFQLATLVGSILFFIYTLYCLFTNKKRPPRSILLTILLGASLELPLFIISFGDTLVSQPSVYFKYISILVAYLVYSTRPLWCKFIIGLGWISLVVWFSYYGYGFWLNKVSFGTFTCKTEQTIENTVIFQDAEGENVYLSDFRGKYLVLDFWNSGCGVCFRKFPDVQKIYDELKNEKGIELYSIFCWGIRGGETSQKGLEILNEYGYTFPTLSLDINNPLMKELGVDRFPTVIVFNPNGKLIFRGSIEDVGKYIQELKANENKYR